MEQYIRERTRSSKTATVMGIVLTVGIHVAAAVCVSFSGISYLYPPPEEETFLLDFVEEVEPQPKQTQGRQPSAEDPDPTKPVEYVQQSESPYVAENENLTPKTAPDDFGDVETPAPEVREEEVLDTRAAFPGMSKKDTSLTAPHSASAESATFKAGQSDGNVNKAATSGDANVKVKGRTIKGSVPKPSYKSQAEGTVVVRIYVDQYGNVTNANPGIEGTTVTDKTLWNEARKAAMETKFNMSADAPALQEGTITYIFNLK